MQLKELDLRTSNWHQQRASCIDINFEDSAAEPLILINPEITDFGTTLNSYEEGCLSIPGVYLNVVRPSTIKLKFRDEMGRPRKMKADGLGEVYSTRNGSLKRNIICR